VQAATQQQLLMAHQQQQQLSTRRLVMGHQSTQTTALEGQLQAMLQEVTSATPATVFWLVSSTLASAAPEDVQRLVLGVSLCRQVHTGSVGFAGHVAGFVCIMW
jgi:hypothetical protein